jgi:adenosylcobinamide kinase/adenosylcobinamide-phosphate guanylyltransferase
LWPRSRKEPAIDALAKKIVVVGGGARSGKSSFALSLAERLGERRLFLATAQALDDEMRQRIDRHRRERGARFSTCEEPIDLSGALQRHSQFDVVLIDCLTLWLSNLLLAGRSEGDILCQIDELAAILSLRGQHVIMVTNEVGMGLVPDSPLGRSFRDLAGLAHQRLSRCADEVYLAVLGIVLRIKPGGICVEDER